MKPFYEHIIQAPFIVPFPGQCVSVLVEYANDVKVNDSVFIYSPHGEYLWHWIVRAVHGHSTIVLENAGAAVAGRTVHSFSIMRSTLFRDEKEDSV